MASSKGKPRKAHSARHSCSELAIRDSYRISKYSLGSSVLAASRPRRTFSSHHNAAVETGSSFQVEKVPGLFCATLDQDMSDNATFRPSRIRWTKRASGQRACKVCILRAESGVLLPTKAFPRFWP